MSTGSTTGADTGLLRVVVAPVRSILQPQVAGLGDLEPVELVIGDEVELENVVRRLSAAAYHRVDLVERRGEFAVRGGIVDVFPPTEEHPLRVEFWGDEIEEIRSFSVADQRTLEKVERLWAPPCRELLLTDEVRASARRLGEQHPELREITEKLAAELHARVEAAGVQIIESRFTHLAYAPEIASAMLQRQQAGAVVAARRQIVDGAVGMVEMALALLSAKNVVELDDERRAAMVSNLMVVLCGERDTQPVVNTGSLYQ